MKITKNIFNFEDKNISNIAYKLAKNLQKKYPNVELGRNRIVFISKFCVFKVPTCNNGCIDNDWESSLSNAEIIDIEEIYYANTKSIILDDLLCCVMQKVDPYNFKDYKLVPDWVKSVDGGQVGHSRKGILMAYDFGLR
jgi:hypothetical protein